MRRSYLSPVSALWAMLPLLAAYSTCSTKVLSFGVAESATTERAGSLRTLPPRRPQLANQS